MGRLYSLLLTLHNALGGLTLLLTIAAALVLLFTQRATSSGSALILRADLISASLQFVIGVILLVVSALSIGTGNTARYWFHYLLGIAAVGVVSAVVARARRGGDSQARRYGLIMLGVVVLVLATFLAGQYRNLIG